MILILARIRFKQVLQELCCIIKDRVIIFFYVDDIIIAYYLKHKQEADNAIKQIQEQYLCTRGDDL